MSEPIPILRELHRLRRNAKDLQDQVDRIPNLLKGQHAKVARQEDLLRQEQETLKRLKITLHEKEVSLKGLHQQIARHKEQLNQSQAKKEYDALQLEIVHEKQAGDKLENEILETMSEIEERTAKVPELEQAVKKTKEDAARFEHDSQQRKASFVEQLEKARGQLAEVEDRISVEMRPQYDRLVAARGEDAMAAVQKLSRMCLACYTEITMQMYNDLLSERMVLCKSCGRLLYLPE